MAKNVNDIIRRLNAAQGKKNGGPRNSTYC